MKRHPALASLSRDHHHALVLAQSVKHTTLARLKAPWPSDPVALIAELRARFARELEPHFEVEERELVPASEARGLPLSSHALRIRRDHDALRTAIATLAPESLTAQLDAFGELLEEHVRFEERVWFPALEAGLGDEALVALLPHWPRLPAGAREYKRTAELDETTVPAGLKRSHRLKAGTWAEIVVTEGRVLYVLEDEDDLELMLRPGLSGVVAPERPHHVELQPGARFFVRFMR